MKTSLKDSFKKIRVTKETLIFLGLVIFLGVVASSGVLAWFRYHHDLSNRLLLIEGERLGVSHEEIKLEDLARIEKFFEERQVRYEASDSIKVREAF